MGCSSLRLWDLFSFKILRLNYESNKTTQLHALEDRCPPLSPAVSLRQGDPDEPARAGMEVCANVCK